MLAKLKWPNTLFRTDTIPVEIFFHHKYLKAPTPNGDSRIGDFTKRLVRLGDTVIPFRRTPSPLFETINSSMLEKKPGKQFQSLNIYPLKRPVSSCVCWWDKHKNPTPLLTFQKNSSTICLYEAEVISQVSYTCSNKQLCAIKAFYVRSKLFAFINVHKNKCSNGHVLSLDTTQDF